MPSVSVLCESQFELEFKIKRANLARKFQRTFERIDFRLNNKIYAHILILIGIDIYTIYIYLYLYMI